MESRRVFFVAHLDLEFGIVSQCLSQIAQVSKIEGQKSRNVFFEEVLQWFCRGFTPIRKGENDPSRLAHILLKWVLKNPPTKMVSH